MKAPKAVVVPERAPYMVRALKRNPSLAKLIEWWPAVDREGTNEQVMERWAELSGVWLPEVRKWWTSLFRSGFVREDGTVDPWVARYLTALAIADMPRDARPARTPPKSQGAADGQRRAEATPSSRRGTDPFAAPEGDTP